MGSGFRRRPAVASLNEAGTQLSFIKLANENQILGSIGAGAGMVGLLALGPFPAVNLLVQFVVLIDIKM
jgi:hypothetical protein